MNILLNNEKKWGIVPIYIKQDLSVKENIESFFESHVKTYGENINIKETYLIKEETYEVSRNKFETTTNIMVTFTY